LFLGFRVERDVILNSKSTRFTFMRKIAVDSLRKS
jgi:hypothetical protein